MTVRFSVPHLAARALLALCVTLATFAAHAGEAVPPFVQQMVGSWDVQQRMWPAAGADAVNLPPATARRRLVGTFLEEMMELVPGATEEPFTRIAYLNYNNVNRQYEYVSVDTRAGQLMNEKGSRATATAQEQTPSGLALQGGSFLAPRWGDATNVSFKYRLVLTPVAQNRQEARLYLTPLSGKNRKEFVAFEYVYTRQSKQ